MLTIPKIPVVRTFWEQVAAVTENVFKTNVLVNDDYILTVNGEPCGVRQCRVSAVPFNKVWPGHQRPLDQSELASFAYFYGDEPVTLQVECKRAFKTAVVRPLSKEVSVVRDGQKLTFTLERNGDYVLELDDVHYALHIFYSAPKDNAGKETATYSFGPGVHFPGHLNLKSNDSVYIDPEALVYTSIHGENLQNVRIFGGGIIDGSCEERPLEWFTGRECRSNIFFHNGKNIAIEDVILMNSPGWVLSIFNSENVKLHGIKEIGHWRYNTDGMDIANSRNVSIKDCFIRSFDDVIALKGYYGFQSEIPYWGVPKEMDKPIENITVENCVLWCDWGKTLEIGEETGVSAYRNISFRDCDLIHSSDGAMTISCCGLGGQVHDLSYENIRVEYQKSTRPMMYQDTDDKKYYDTGRTSMAQLIVIDNSFKEGSSRCYFKSPEEYRPEYEKVYDITYKNLQIYTEPGMPLPRIAIVSKSEELPVENVHFEGIYLNGVQLDGLDQLRLTVENAKNITYKKM